MTRTILLADDSVTIQKVVELTFMDQDYEIEAVSDGSAALAKLPELKPDLLIADVHMPGADGYAVCRRSKELYPEVPVLLLVGTFEHFDDAAAVAAGAESHLKKPFDSQDLLHQVEALISGAGGRAAGEEPAEAGADAAREAAALPAVDLEPPALTEEEVTSVSEAAWELEAEPETPVGEPPAGGTPFPLSSGAGPETAPRQAPPSQPAAPAAETTFDAWGVEVPAAEALAAEALDAEALDAEALDAEALDAVPSAWETEAMPAWGRDSAGEESIAAEPGTVEPLAEAAVLEAPTLEEPAALGLPSDEPTFGAPTAESAAEESPAEAEAAEPAEEVAAVAGTNGLSDADVDRIARRMIELVGDKALREVAWEVVPDLAEVIIKERIRELESQVE